MRVTFGLLLIVAAVVCAICAVAVGAAKREKSRGNIVIAIANSSGDNNEARASAKTNRGKGKVPPMRSLSVKASKVKDILAVLAWVKATHSKAAEAVRCTEYDKQLRRVFGKQAKKLNTIQLIEYAIAFKGQGMHETLIADLIACQELADKGPDAVITEAPAQPSPPEVANVAPEPEPAPAAPASETVEVGANEPKAAAVPEAPVEGVVESQIAAPEVVAEPTYVEEKKAPAEVERNTLTDCQVLLRYERGRSQNLEAILTEDQDELDDLRGRFLHLEGLVNSAQLEAQQAKKALEETKAKLAEAEAELNHLHSLPPAEPCPPAYGPKLPKGKHLRNLMMNANNQMKFESSSLLDESQSLDFSENNQVLFSPHQQEMEGAARI